MDDGLKQRIIGAVVLLAVAVIFIPVVFDRERIEPVDKKTQIPVPPHIETVKIEKPKPVSNKKRVASPDEIFVPDEKKVQSSDPVKVKPNSDGSVQSWVLQVASFLHEKHANDFRDKLIAEGLPSYTRKVKTSKGNMARVFVGPKLSKAKILQDKKTLKEKFNSEALLLKFEP